ncbi:MAG: adenylate/guanylate cyclase domain-containing protein [Anaerolineales bacterium]
MENPVAYIPIDRRLALANGRELPERTRGAALFADISGFTPLTEMLARTLGPKRGAEELTRYLNQVYDALITELHRFGGSVLGFSGDAITCWFDEKSGEDIALSGPSNLLAATLRATASAIAMQKAMAQFATLEVVEGGTVSLAMKAAVAAGPVRRFIVGDPEYTLLDVMAGQTLEHLAAAEHQANKGDVVLDAVAAEILQDQVELIEWRTDDHSGERFAVIVALKNAVPEHPWPLLDEKKFGMEEARPWLIPAVYRLLRAGQGQFLAELRPASALFLRFTGIDYDQDPDAPKKLDTFIRQIQRILARYDGSLLQVTIGDKGSYLYAAFGAPIAHEDDVDRAASAALELQALPEHLPFLEPLQIGITYGRMRVGAYGGTARRTYGVLGDAVNLSARLMQAAQPGQTLASEEAYTRAGGTFLWETLPPIRVKGKTDPITIFRLDRVRHRRVGVSLEARFPLPPLGREAMLTGLDTALTGLVNGVGQIVRLVGAAGMGKSHLAAHFIRQAREKNTQVVTGICQSITRSAPYTPWRQIFYALLGLQESSETEALEKLTAFLQTQHPEWLLRLPLLGDLLGLPIPDNPTTAALDSNLRQASLFSLLVEMVQTWAKQQPLILLIDNAHWMDEVSLSLTQTLAQQGSGTSPTLIFLAHRPPAPGDPPLLPELAELPHYYEFSVIEMTDLEVGMLVERVMQAPATELLMDVVERMARGNPLFAAELLDAMREDGQIVLLESGAWGLSFSLLEAFQRANFVVQQDAQWRLRRDSDLSTVKLGIPDSIHGLVLSRLDRLPEAHKLTLKVSSVIGHIVDLMLVSQAHPEEKDVTEIVAEAELLEMEEVMQVEAPEKKLYTFRHHTTHEVAYDTLLYTQRQQLHQAVAEALAEHQPEATIQIAYHAFAGELWGLSLRYNLLAGAQAKQLHATQQGIDFFQKALKSAGQLPEIETVQERLKIHLSLGELYVTTGHYEDAGEHLKNALFLARLQGDHEAEAQSCRWYARSHEQKGEYAQALTWVDRGFLALDGATSLEEAELSLLSGLVYVRQGNFAKAIELCERSLQVGEVLSDIAIRARAYNLLGIIDLRSSSGSAIERFQESLHQYEQIGNVYGQATSHNLIANGYFAKGELSLADLHYRQSLNLFTQIGHVYNQVLVNNNLGGIAIKQGRLDAALGYYQRAVRQLEQIHGSLWVFGALHLNIGNTLIQKAELAQALPELQLALNLFEQAQVRDLLPELYGLFAELYCRQGDPVMAEHYGLQSLELARELEMPREEGHNLRIMGEIAYSQGDAEKAQAFLAQSYQILSDAGDEYESAKTQLSLAKLYKEQNASEQALISLNACKTIFERLEAQMDLQQVERLLSEFSG